MSFCFFRYRPTAASSVFLSSHVAGPGGIFESIFWNYKESTHKERGIRSNAGRRVRIYCFLHLDLCLVSFVLRISYSVYDLS